MHAAWADWQMGCYQSEWRFIIKRIYNKYLKIDAKIIID